MFFLSEKFLEDDFLPFEDPINKTRGTKVWTMDFEEIPKKTDFENLSVAACMATTEKFQIPDFRKTSKDTFGLLSFASNKSYLKKKVKNVRLPLA